MVSSPSAAVIATALNAKRQPGNNGLRSGRQSYCRSLIFMSCSPYPKRCKHLDYKTSRCSMICCFVPVPKLCCARHLTLGIWRPNLASLVCCTLGGRTCSIILTFIV